MALQFDYNNFVITVPQADLTLIGGTLYELDTNQFRLDVIAELGSVNGIWAKDAILHNTEVTVAGTTFARTIEVINGWSITFEDGQYTIRLTGSNNNIFDVQNMILNQNQVQIIAQNSAGLVNAGFSQVDRDTLNLIKYQDQKVFINTELVPTGDGTARSPFNNIGDALDFAENNNIRQLVFLADGTLDRNLKNFRIEGLGLAIVDLDGNDVSGSIFDEVRVRGENTGPGFFSILTGALEDGLSGLNGGFLDVNITGEVTLKDNGLSLITNLAIARIATPPAILMPAAGPHRCAIQNCHGNLILKDFTLAGHEISMSVNGGIITIDPSCTGGSITITGSAKVVDNSAGATVDKSGITSSAVWDENL